MTKFTLAGTCNNACKTNSAHIIYPVQTCFCFGTSFLFFSNVQSFENENLNVSSSKSKRSVYVVPTQHKKRIKLNANLLMQYARIDTALQPLHTCFFVPLFFTHVFSSVLMFQIGYENHGLPIS